MGHRTDFVSLRPRDRTIRPGPAPPRCPGGHALVGATKALYLELRWDKVREPKRAEPPWRAWRQLLSRRRGRR